MKKKFFWTKRKYNRFSPVKLLIFCKKDKEAIYMPVKNEIGNTYGYLTVIERAENTKEGRAQWKCKCKCGNELIVLGKHLRSGNTKSCGCY